MGRWSQAWARGQRTDAALEAQVVAVRRRLAENPWAQVGSDAIAWELDKLGIQAPCTRTIERILARAGLIGERRRERPKSKGVPYPLPPADRVGDLHQADLAGPRHLDGGMPFVALNCVDIVPHAAAIEIAPDQTEATITASLIRLWERLGVSRRLQLDNGKPFVLGSASLGEIVRVHCTRAPHRSSSRRAGLSDEVCVVVVIDQRLAARPVRTGAPEGRASWPAWRAARKETHHHEFHAV